MIAVDVPIVFVESARKLLTKAQEQNLGPDHFEIRFGEGALEILGRDVRRVTSVTTIFDLPVLLPEEPHSMEKVVDLKLVCEHGHLRLLITAEAVKWSA